MRGEEIAYLGINAAGEQGVFFVSVFGYPSGEPLVKERPRHVDRVLLRPRSMQALLGGLFWVDALVERGHVVPPLILPFVPGSRQDRLNPDGDFLFTAKSVARMINERRFPRVTVLDPHSEVISALIDRCHVLRPADTVKIPAGKYAAVISPDAGAEKRVSGVAHLLGVPMIRGWKKRDVATGALSGFGLEPTELPTRSLVLVVDDICDGGGTFLGLADPIDAAGLRAHLYVTHGLFTKGTDELLRRYHGHVYCTDSAAVARPGIIVSQICDRMLTTGEDTK